MGVNNAATRLEVVRYASHITLKRKLRSGQVIEAPLTAAQRLLLWTLADFVYSDEDREAWPSIVTLHVFTGIDEREIQRHLRDFEANGLITTVEQSWNTGRNRQSSTKYRINPLPGAPADGSHLKYEVWREAEIAYLRAQKAQRVK